MILMDNFRAWLDAGWTPQQLAAHGHARVVLEAGDCRELLRTLPDACIDAIVTDPPYELGFMGKSWDASGIAYDVTVWREALRVLKPGGHMLAFSGSRTYHRMVVAIEDAGFEIRDQIMWLYGCLDEKTEVATSNGVMPYHKTKIGDLVLCYDAATGEYSHQPILEIVEYDYSDTAYRLIGDFGEQIVSRNHRVIVERGGIESFQLAETLERETRIPVLESLPDLQRALHDLDARASDTKQDLQRAMCGGIDRAVQHRPTVDAGSTQGSGDCVRELRSESMETRGVVTQNERTDVQPQVQRHASRDGLGDARSPGARSVDARIGGGVSQAHDGRDKPGLAGRCDVCEPKGPVRDPAHPLCAVPARICCDGAQGRVCDGASPTGGTSVEKVAIEGGGGPSHQPRCDGQPAAKSDALCDQRRAQGIRAWPGHHSAVVRVVPFQYTGKVWCLRVPTGAFVAVRNGVAFPTGNSGFPKSLDVSKAIDKAAGADRVRVLVPSKPGNTATRGQGPIDMQSGFTDVSEPVTPEAQQWDGWGTALKPAHEPICVARKPLVGTVAANVLAHGTGALNIDGCRIGDTVESWPKSRSFRPGISSGYTEGIERGATQSTGDAPAGRWPANVVHDGSDGVRQAFPKAKGEQGDLKETSAARFFYCAKASKADRGEGNTHPTVKPNALMRYLCKLVTPPGGLVLDPFLGSGSTALAAHQEGFRFYGCDLDPAHVAIATRRFES